MGLVDQFVGNNLTQQRIDTLAISFKIVSFLSEIMNTSDSTMEKILSNQLKMVDYISLALNQQAVLFKEIDNLKGRLSELEKGQE